MKKKHRKGLRSIKPISKTILILSDKKSLTVLNASSRKAARVSYWLYYLAYVYVTINNFN